MKEYVIAFIVLILSCGFLFAERSYTNIDLVGKYEFPLMLGGTVEFCDSGICVITMFPPPLSGKGSLVIKETYNVVGDIIYFETIEKNGLEGDHKKSKQRIISLNEKGLSLMDYSSGNTRLYRKLSDIHINNLDPNAIQVSEEKIKEQILAWHIDLASEDEKIRLKALDRLNPTLDDLKGLLGDDAKLIWPFMEKWLVQMRNSSDEVRKERIKHGPIQSIILINIRTDKASQVYERVLKRIPKSVPVYRVVTKYEKATTGISTFVVVNKKLKLIKGLEIMPEVIDTIREQNKDINKERDSGDQPTSDSGNAK